ncbi:GNAT family N-acetyltransferase [Saccharopolyspora shandongensis]|uniref:GNAT family N-acetyltransferase n=1 Tax=Saccharopolyspora shandongensis TaxID=418495 RepID=UPI0033C6B5C8
MTTSPLDNPAWASLTGPHAGFAEKHGQVLRYPVDVAPFLAIPDEFGDDGWRDVAALAGPGAVVAFSGPPRTPPPGWEVVERLPGVQLVDDGVVGAEDDEAVRLTAADVPEMLDLVKRTQPGPFLPRVVELGTYLGVRRGGELIAMAGERLHPPGWTEISAACTDPAFRGQGLATRLVRAVVAGIRTRGEKPLLHTVASNTGAIRLYESMGFRLRYRLFFTAVRVPEA